MIVINDLNLSQQEAGALLELLDRVSVKGIEETMVFAQLITKLNTIMTSGVGHQGENSSGGE